MPTSPPPSPPIALAYSISAAYANCVNVTYINGVFRLTFFEQHVSPKPGSTAGEVDIVTSPRAAIVLTPESSAEFLRTFGDLFNAVAKSVREASWAEGFHGSNKGTMQ